MRACERSDKHQKGTLFSSQYSNALSFSLCRRDKSKTTDQSMFPANSVLSSSSSPSLSRIDCISWCEKCQKSSPFSVMYQSWSNRVPMTIFQPIPSLTI